MARDRRGYSAEGVKPEMLNRAELGDAIFDKLRKHFTEGEIVELAILVARHFAFGRLTKVLVIDHVCALPGQEPTRD